MENIQPPHWVKKRAECSLDLIYAALCQLVERDVEEMNALPESQRQSRTFRLEKNTDGDYPILRVLPSEGDSSVFFQRKRDVIYINGKTVCVRWDNEIGSCRLALDDEQLEVWQVSQRALEPLFFGDDK